MSVHVPVRPKVKSVGASGFWSAVDYLEIVIPELQLPGAQTRPAIRSTFKEISLGYDISNVRLALASQQVGELRHVTFCQHAGQIGSSRSEVSSQLVRLIVFGPKRRGAKQPAYLAIGAIEPAIYGVWLKEGNLAWRDPFDALSVEIATLAVGSTKDQALDPEIVAVSPGIEPQPERCVRRAIVI